MIVHRLRVWASRLMAPLAAAWHRLVPARTRRSRSSQAAPATLAVVGAPARHRSGLATSTWLRDSHRLRARPDRRKGLPAPAREQLRQIMRDPRWMATYDTAAAARPPRLPQATDPRPTPHSGESTASRPLAAPGPSASADQRSNSERRRLNYVRELVERGIYNEGFDPTQLPEQYRPRPRPPDSSPPEWPAR